MRKIYGMVILIFTMNSASFPAFCEVFTFEDFQSQLNAEPKAEVKTEEQIAIEDAKRDVNKHIDKYKWFTTGCILPIISLSLSQKEQEKIPVARLIGKNQIYVAFYTEQYRIEMNKSRYMWALRGCTLSSLITGSIVYFVVRLRD